MSNSESDAYYPVVLDLHNPRVSQYNEMSCSNGSKPGLRSLHSLNRTAGWIKYLKGVEKFLDAGAMVI